MKKHFLITIIALVFASAGYSQTGIGIRGGMFGVDGNSYGGLEVSLQGIASYELDFGYIDGGNWKFTALKLFKLIGKREGFCLYAGLGAGAGLVNGTIIENEFHANLAVDVGVSLRILKFLQFTLDYRPEWAMTNNSYTDTAFEWGNIALGARIVF